MIKTMSNCIEIKDKEQRKALNLWAHNKFHGSIIAGTGFGKTRVGVLAVGKMLEYYPDDKALVLVPTTQLQDQFRDEFIKWGYVEILDKVDIQCYQSAYKFKNKEYRVVIADEVHLGLSKQHYKFFENNKYDKLLCLTATIPEDLEYKAKLEELAPIVYRLK